MNDTTNKDENETIAIFNQVESIAGTIWDMASKVWNIKSTAASDFWFEWHGIAAYAGATPWDGRSALQAAQLLLHGVDMMREDILPMARMHYIITEGGNAVNAVPDYAKVVFRYRGHNAEDMLKNVEWVKYSKPAEVYH